MTKREKEFEKEVEPWRNLLNIANQCGMKREANMIEALMPRFNPKDTSWKKKCRKEVARQKTKDRLQELGRI